MRIIAFGSQLMRAVTHLDVTTADVDRAATVLDEVAARGAEHRTRNAKEQGGPPETARRPSVAASTAASLLSRAC